MKVGLEKRGVRRTTRVVLYLGQYGRYFGFTFRDIFSLILTFGLLLVISGSPEVPLQKKNNMISTLCFQQVKVLSLNPVKLNNHAMGTDEFPKDSAAPFKS